MNRFIFKQSVNFLLTVCLKIEITNIYHKNIVAVHCTIQIWQREKSVQ